MLSDGIVRCEGKGELSVLIDSFGKKQGYVGVEGRTLLVF